MTDQAPGRARPSDVVLHTDGGARGNPGPAAIGVVVEAQDEEGRELLVELGEVIGVATNNVAEYRALIRGLEEATRIGARRVTCLLDSQLVVEQMSGRYKVKHENVVGLHRQATELSRGFDKVAYRYIPRAQNSEADRLVNEALDGKRVALPEAPGAIAPGAAAKARQTVLALGAQDAAGLLTEAFRDAVEVPRLALEKINRALPASERYASEAEAWRARWAVAVALGEFAVQLGMVTREEVEALADEFRGRRPL